jgi:hypothetical protein
MSPPGNYPLTLYRGDTYAWRFLIWNNADGTDPHDLTDVVPKAEIRERPMGAVIIPLDCVVELPNAVVATLGATQSERLPSLGGRWDLRLTAIGGEVFTVLAGAVSVTPQVTDSTPLPTRGGRS